MVSPLLWSIFGGQNRGPYHRAALYLLPWAYLAARARDVGVRVRYIMHFKEDKPRPVHPPSISSPASHNLSCPPQFPSALPRPSLMCWFAAGIVKQAANKKQSSVGVNRGPRSVAQLSQWWLGHRQASRAFWPNIRARVCTYLQYSHNFSVTFQVLHDERILTPTFLPSPTSLSLPIWPFSVGKDLPTKGPPAFYPTKDDLCRKSSCNR